MNALTLRGIVADRDVDLFASAPDHAEETRELDLRGCSEMRLDFALSRGLEAPLQVVDGETGAPVVGAELLHRRGSREAFARTDEGGHAVVRAIEVFRQDFDFGDMRVLAPLQHSLLTHPSNLLIIFLAQT